MIGEWLCFKCPEGPEMWAWNIKDKQGYWIDEILDRVPRKEDKSNLRLEDFTGRGREWPQCWPPWVMLDPDLEVDEGL